MGRVSLLGEPSELPPEKEEPVNQLEQKTYGSIKNRDTLRRLGRETSEFLI